MREMSMRLKVEDPRKGNTGESEEKPKTKKVAPPTYPKPISIRMRRFVAAPMAKSQKEESKKIELVEVDDDAVGREMKRAEKDAKEKGDEREEEHKKTEGGREGEKEKREPEADGDRESGGDSGRSRGDGLEVEETEEVAEVREKREWSDSAEEEDDEEDEKSRTYLEDLRKQRAETVERNVAKMKEMVAEGKGGDAFFDSIKTLFEDWKEFSKILTELTDRVLTGFQEPAEDRDHISNYQTEESAKNTLLAGKLWTVVNATEAEVGSRVRQFHRAGFKVEEGKVSVGDIDKYVNDYGEEDEEKETLV